MALTPAQRTMAQNNAGAMTPAALKAWRTTSGDPELAAIAAAELERRTMTEPAPLPAAVPTCTETLPMAWTQAHYRCSRPAGHTDSHRAHSDTLYNEAHPTGIVHMGAVWPQLDATDPDAVLADWRDRVRRRLSAEADDAKRPMPHVTSRTYAYAALNQLADELGYSDPRLAALRDELDPLPADR